jgi:exopolysaccharide biosynthesis protein
MIEATSENLWYKKKKKKFKIKKIFIIFLTFSILFLLVFHYRKNVCVQINNICSDYAYSFCTDAVNKAVLSSLNDTVKYDSLISIEKNSSGEIIFMGCDAVKVNSLSKNIALLAQHQSAERIVDEIVKIIK